MVFGVAAVAVLVVSSGQGRRGMLGGVGAASIDSVGASDGQVLTADGSGGSAFENAVGGVDTSGTPVDDDFAKFTDADTIEGRSYAEVKADLSLEIGTDVLAEQAIGIADDNLVEIDDADAADDDYAKLTANGIEGRSYAEVKSDLSLGADYGEISVEGNGSGLTLTDQNTWYQVTDFDTNGVSNGATPDHTNDHITIGTTGTYVVSLTGNLEMNAAGVFEYQISKNNNGTALRVHEYEPSATAKQGPFAITTLLTLSQNDTIEVWVRCTSVANRTLIFKHACLTLHSLP
jgi:hypothetical protein